MTDGYHNNQLKQNDRYTDTLFKIHPNHTSLTYQSIIIISVDIRHQQFSQIELFSVVIWRQFCTFVWWTTSGLVSFRTAILYFA